VQRGWIGEDWQCRNQWFYTRAGMTRIKLTPTIDGTYFAEATGGAASAGQLNTIIDIRLNRYSCRS
jgi:hypothetical protein